MTSGGLNPPPQQKPIPIWMGGGVGRGGIVPAALKRVARVADGWCPLPAANPDMMIEAREILKRYLIDEGKDPASFPIEMRTTRGGPDDWAAQTRTEAALGTDYFTVVPAGVNHGVEAHLKALEQFKKAVV